MGLPRPRRVLTPRLSRGLSRALIAPSSSFSRLVATALASAASTPAAAAPAAPAAAATTATSFTGGGGIRSVLTRNWST
jgi:hypothetical protein